MTESKEDKKLREPRPISKFTWDLLDWWCLRIEGNKNQREENNKKC
jgi:hypothetical protein